MFKARRDTAAATGHANINTAKCLSYCTTINTGFALLFRVGVGVDVNKTQSNPPFSECGSLTRMERCFTFPVSGVSSHIYIFPSR